MCRASVIADEAVHLILPQPRQVGNQVLRAKVCRGEAAAILIALNGKVVANSVGAQDLLQCMHGAVTASAEAGNGNFIGGELTEDGA